MRVVAWMSVLFFLQTMAVVAQPQHQPRAPEILQSETLGATGPLPFERHFPPDYYDLNIGGDVKLGGSVFKYGFYFLHTYGGSDGGNTALGIDAMVNLTPGTPYADSGKLNTGVGLGALYFNSTGSRNTAIGYAALSENIDGSANTACGAKALEYARYTSQNTAVGALALRYNKGNQNTASGAYALTSNSTGSLNTAAGASALFSNYSGDRNTASGAFALLSSWGGSDNTASGALTLFYNTTGSGNTANGSKALYKNTTGGLNTATGHYALHSNTDGGDNTAVGTGALSHNSSGSRNLALGRNAGSYNTTGSYNIWIGHPGTHPGTASYTIRIGHVLEQQAFIAGIRGVTTGSMDALSVVIDSQGQLGTVSSSRRFKEAIEGMGDVSERLMDLRPVTFRYKQKPASGESPQRFGLIAEEVLEVFPELVALDETGQPEAVLYRLLPSLLLNELQKQHRLLRVQWAFMGLMFVLTIGLAGRRRMGN